MCTSGKGFSSWGAGMGVNINSGTSAIPCLYDASVFSGISFALSGSVASGYLRFYVVTAGTTSTAYGGTCTSGTSCNDYFGIALLPNTSTPVTVKVPFTLLAQEGWGAAVKWDPTQILGIQLQVRVDHNNLFGPATPVDYSNICVENITFF
jgi:hypothetical protein